MKKILLAIVVVMFLGALALSAKNPAVTVKPETISGVLTIVTPADKVIFVKADNGITYDFRVGPATKIVAGDAKLKFDDLTDKAGKQVEVVFRPLKTGNAALSIDIK